MADLDKLIEEVVPEIVELRHAIHAHPELGYEEEETSKCVLDQLAKVDGLGMRTGVAETGIVATLGADKPGPCVALRADMDALDDPKVDAIFGIHGWPQLPQGEVGVHAGAFLAASDQFDMTIEGVGAHAAFPHLGVDPIVIASLVISAAQSIVSRTTDPLQSAVVTFGQIVAGTTFNIIPQAATLKGTIRTLEEGMRRQTHRKLEEIAKGVAEGMGGRATVEVRDGYPITYNDESAVAFVERVFEGDLGTQLVSVPLSPVMDGEDFSYFAERVPATFVALGVRPPDRETYPNLHQSDYDFHDGAIPLAIRYHVEVARAFATRWK